MSRLRTPIAYCDIGSTTIKLGFVLRRDIIRRICTQFLLAAVVFVGLAFLLGGYVQALAHEDHDHFSAGEPGNPQKPSRTVNVSMLEEGKRMLFDPRLSKSSWANRSDLYSSTKGVSIMNSCWRRMLRTGNMLS